MTTNEQTKKHTGSCHCGAVAFEVHIDATNGSRCNCSICAKLCQTGGIAKPEALVVTRGESELTGYQWGGRTATRYFCKHCGITCFSRGSLPELGGAYVSINLNTLDGVDPSTIDVVYWDGRNNNWEAGPSKTPWPIYVESGNAARAQMSAASDA